VLPLAGALAVTPIDSGSYSLDHFCSTYVFFLMGYYGSGMILEAAQRVKPIHAAILVPLYTAVTLAVIYADLRQIPMVWLACAIFGIFAMATLCICLSELRLDGIFRYMGSYSLPIFVSHTIATAGTRVILLKLGLTDHSGLLLVGATLGGVMLPILLAETCERLKFPWLFRKPDWLTINPPAPSKATDRGLADPSAQS
jgi:uncharacterized membrane protein YcfT